MKLKELIENHSGDAVVIKARMGCQTDSEDNGFGTRWDDPNAPEDRYMSEAFGDLEMKESGKEVSEDGLETRFESDWIDDPNCPGVKLKFRF